MAWRTKKIIADPDTCISIAVEYTVAGLAKFDPSKEIAAESIIASHKQYIGNNFKIQNNAIPTSLVVLMILRMNTARATIPPSTKLWIKANFSPESSEGKMNEKKYE